MPYATNRTNLELKPNTEWDFRRLTKLPIVPIWNWNALGLCGQLPAPRLPIVPIWNWNHEVLSEYIKKNKLPIVPIWNWNNPTAYKTEHLVYYQSYQSGIETGLVCCSRHDTRSTNRTNLELKRGKGTRGALHSWPYQSYQSGIETSISATSTYSSKKLPIVPIWNWNDKMGYTGMKDIELPIVPIWNWNKIPFASHFQLKTTNRTNLELKHYKRQGRVDCEIYQSYQSGIETSILSSIGRVRWIPIWNWNYASKWKQGKEGKATNRTNLELKHDCGFDLCFFGYATNRTNLELKLEAAEAAKRASDYQSYQSGIETFSQKVFIRPMVTTNRTNLELKLVLLHNLYSQLAPTNRTNLELKHGRPSFSFTSFPLPIVPIWNWNFWEYSPTRAQSPYQSYQSGIETVQGIILSEWVTIYQSYQSGIETIKRESLSLNAVVYQSYQSGIETLI